MSYDNEYQKWKFLIALAHVDKRLMLEEQDFLYDKIKTHADESLHARLYLEVKDCVLYPSPPNFHLFAINAIEDKVDLLTLAHKLFWSDGDLDPREKLCLDRIVLEIKKDMEALALLQNSMPDWDNDEGTKALITYIEEQL